MLSEALSFPRSGDDWLETVLVGGVLSLLGAFVIPAIVVNGYLLRVLRAAVEGDPTPPRFSDWVDLLVDGLLVLVVEFVYVGVPSFFLAGAVVAVAVPVGVVVGTAEPGPGVLAGTGVVLALLLLAVTALLLVAAYLLPAALANFARTDELAAAFDLRTVVRAAFTVDYALAVALAIVVSLVLGLVGGLLVFVLVGFFVLFYLQVVVHHLFGRGFARGLDIEPTAPPAGDPSG